MNESTKTRREQMKLNIFRIFPVENISMMNWRWKIRSFSSNFPFLCDRRRQTHSSSGNFIRTRRLTRRKNTVKRRRGITDTRVSEVGNLRARKMLNWIIWEITKRFLKAAWKAKWKCLNLSYGSDTKKFKLSIFVALITSKTLCSHKLIESASC